MNPRMLPEACPTYADLTIPLSYNILLTVRLLSIISGESHV
jgi:hypothetical protein